MDLYLEFTIVQKVNDRIYRLSLPYGDPYSRAIEALEGFKAAVLEIEERAKSAAQQKADQEKGCGPCASESSCTQPEG